VRSIKVSDWVVTPVLPASTITSTRTDRATLMMSAPEPPKRHRPVIGVSRIRLSSTVATGACAGRLDTPLYACGDNTIPRYGK
jgi:hypothetical protein